MIDVWDAGAFGNRRIDFAVLAVPFEIESYLVIIAADERAVREFLAVLDGESWSVGRYVRESVLPHCGSFQTLQRICVVLGGLCVINLWGGLQNHVLAIIMSWLVATRIRRSLL